MNKQELDEKCRKSNQKRKRNSWILNVLIAIDQLGNAIAGGNPNATISARTGFFATHASKRTRIYWLTLEWVIDFSFFPVDGPNHCQNATKNEGEKHIQGNDFMRGILGIFVMIAAVPISIATMLWVLINPCAHYTRKILS